MVKKLTTLTTLLLLSYTTLSQVDTSRICFSYDVVKNISIELAQKDSLEAELQETNKLVTTYKSILSLQDSIIGTYEDRVLNYQDQILTLEEKDDLHTKEVTRLRDENSELTRKNKNLKTTAKILGGGLLGAIVALIIII